jgi:hypothetical protein
MINTSQAIYDQNQAIGGSYFPPSFHVEAVPGGFIVSGNGGRQVARNVHQVARLLREWAPKPEPKAAAAE